MEEIKVIINDDIKNHRDELELMLATHCPALIVVACCKEILDILIKLEKKFISENADEKKTMLYISESIISIFASDIILIEGANQYSKFKLNKLIENKTELMDSRGIGFHEKELTKFNFLLTHQSYLINLKYFYKYSPEKYHDELKPAIHGDGGTITLQPEPGKFIKAPVSRNHKTEVKKRLAQL